jgi:hypothetical protein
MPPRPPESPIVLDLLEERNRLRREVEEIRCAALAIREEARVRELDPRA